ncbi:MAG TPA: hypothetical protein VJU77_16055 [Chthoniobacterales bacterium]|nr:hypothetical protein [Chthoniobacterales bacterium]
MKRFLNIFALTQPEQRIIIILILLLVAAAWFKHQRDLQKTLGPQSKPQGAAVSTPPSDRRFQTAVP